MPKETSADDGGFAEFEAAGVVETGKPDIESNQPEEKPAARRGPPKEAKPAEKVKPEPEAADEEEDEELPEDADEEEDDKPKAKAKASDRIRELNKRLRARERLLDSMSTRMEALEKRGLSISESESKFPGIGDAPDPSDEAKYPLGHLDDRYVQDAMRFEAKRAAAEMADAVLQRQQEGERNQQAQRAHEVLLEKVDDLSTRGSEQFDDFQEAVVEAGMRGDWRLDQPTFEAAHEAENGAQILYELSQDKKEAKRVAELSAYGQLKYVADRDAEIGKGKQPRRIPRAGEPPATQTRGANSRTRPSPYSDNLDTFSKAWEADAKGHG